jgi:HEPN domain-containing protein
MFKKVRKDLDRVSCRLQEKDIEDVAIHLQQALEKYLKGYLLLKGWGLKPTYDLKELLDEVIKFNPDLKQFYDLCLEVTPSLDKGEISFLY